MTRRWCLLLISLLVACERPPAPPASPPPAKESKPAVSESSQPTPTTPPPSPPTPPPSPTTPPSSPPSDAPQDSGPFVGRFAGKGFVLELGPDLRGSLGIGRKGPFPATARLEEDRLQGLFEAKGQTFPFAATRDGEAVLLEADGRTYRLEPVQPAPTLKAGTYGGSLNGLPATLNLTVDGDTVQGHATTRDGYRYRVRATIGADATSGTFKDPESGQALPLTLRPVEEGVELEVSAPGKEPAVVLFRAGQPAPEGQAPERDPLLVGTWTQAEETDALERATLQLRPDGIYFYGTSRTRDVASGAQSSAGQGQLLQGRWRTAEGVLYTQPAGLDGWVRYADYQLDGDRLLLNYEAGKAEPWVRRG